MHTVSTDIEMNCYLFEHSYVDSIVVNCAMCICVQLIIWWFVILINNSLNRGRYVAHYYCTNARQWAVAMKSNSDSSSSNGTGWHLCLKLLYQLLHVSGYFYSKQAASMMNSQLMSYTWRLVLPLMVTDERVQPGTNVALPTVQKNCSESVG